VGSVLIYQHQTALREQAQKLKAVRKEDKI
jgi:hypothetical protein